MLSRSARFRTLSFMTRSQQQPAHTGFVVVIVRICIRTAAVLLTANFQAVLCRSPYWKRSDISLKQMTKQAVMAQNVAVYVKFKLV